MPKYTDYPLLAEDLQQAFVSILEAAPIHVAADILQHAADTLKEKGIQAQACILPSNQQWVDTDNDKLLPAMVVRAIAFAMEAHNRQIRKHPTLVIPYIVHIFDIAARLQHWGITDEVVLTSAILHDVVEDTKYEPADIMVRFDKHVCAIVGQVSEGDYPPGQPKPPKWERKLKYIDKIRNAHPSIARAVMLVSAADKVSNGWDYVSAAENADNLDPESREMNLRFYGELVPIYLENIQVPEMRQNIELLWSRLQKAWV